MAKYIRNLRVVENIRLQPRLFLLKLTDDIPLPAISPGQFVSVRVRTPDAFLRRPFSVHDVDVEQNQLWLLIQLVGAGTRSLAEVAPGETLDVIFPLGKGFTLTEDTDSEVLLVGGGVGIAPLLFLSRELARKGLVPKILLGARSAQDLAQLPLFERFGTVYIATEDGSAGEQGLVTRHTVLQTHRFDRMYVCGPLPMMKAVAQYAARQGVACEVSLENRMACGIGACLCCVEKTVQGHQCVCKEGPVFNIKDLLW